MQGVQEVVERDPRRQAVLNMKGDFSSKFTLDCQE